jgi:hypothetical protein
MSEVNINNRQKQFKEDLKNLNFLSEKIYTSPGFKFTSPAGKNYNKSDLKRFFSRISKDFDEIIKLVSKDKSKKGSKTKKNNSNNPMFAPKYISSNLVEYFKNINLGHAYIQNKDGVFEDKGDLKEYLHLFFDDNLTTCALMTPLFCIATKLNKLQDSNNAQFIVPDKIFDKHFGKIFTELENERKEEEKMLEKKRLNASPEDKREIDLALSKLKKKEIDPKKIRSVRFQTIVSKNTEKDLSSNQRELIKEEKTIKQLNDEQKIVSGTLKYYRQKSKEKKQE